MTRECQQHDDCMEVPLEVEVCVEGYPLVENLVGFAVSLFNDSGVGFVGYEDAMGRRIELTSHEIDGFKKAAYAALMSEANKPWVKAEFDDAFYAHRNAKRTPELRVYEGYA